MVSSYPVQFDVDFPERKLDRLRTALRLIAAIPIVIVLSLLRSDPQRRQQEHSGDRWGDRVPSAGIDARVPAEVPPLVVRLEPQPAALLEPSRRIPGASRRPLSVNR